jgi:RNA polymerase sigma factor (TIGR02999 family)
MRSRAAKLRNMAEEVSRLLADWREGREQARDRLVTLLYPELKKLAGQMFRAERAGMTLQPTALVNEAWLRLASGGALAIEHRAQLFAIAARLMREILVDHARRRGAAKRNGGERVTLSGLDLPNDAHDPDLLDLDTALARLERADAVKSRIVELRYFGGLSVDEVAQTMGLSPATVKRHWQAARLWLFNALGDVAADSSA